MALSPRPALVQLINHVQVPFDALPCLWYFVDPAHSDRVTYVPLTDVVRRRGAAPYSAVDVRHTMRTFAELAWKCADEPPAKRLACVDQGLVNLHRQVFPDKAARPKLRLEHLSLGLSVIQVLMGLPPLL
jgi:hypothetical protein